VAAVAERRALLLRRRLLTLSLSPPTQAAHKRTLELTGPDSKRAANAALDLEAEAEVRKRERERAFVFAAATAAAGSGGARPFRPPLSHHLHTIPPPHTSQRLTASLKLDQPYDIKPIPRPKGW